MQSSELCPALMQDLKLIVVELGVMHIAIVKVRVLSWCGIGACLIKETHCNSIEGPSQRD